MKKYLILLIAIVLGGYFAVDGYITKKNIPTAKDLATVSEADIQKGVYVKSDVNFTLGYYCEETTSRRGITTSKKRYYLIPYGADRSKYIGIKITGSNMDEFQKLESSSASYFLGTGQEPASIGTFYGKLKECDSEESKYLKEFFQDIDSQNPEQYYTPYYFELVTEDGAKNLMMVGSVILGVGVLLLIIFVLVDVKGRNSAAYAGQSDYVSQTPNTYDAQSGPGMSGGQDASQGQFDDLVIPPPGQDNNNNFS